MNRRGFLTSVLAAGCAPAVVRAESLMKILVPSRSIIIPTPAEMTWAVDAIGGYMYSMSLSDEIRKSIMRESITWEVTK